MSPLLALSTWSLTHLPASPLSPLSVWDVRPTTSVRLIGLSSPHLFCKPPFTLGQSTGSPPLCWAPIFTEPTALKLAQDSLGDSSQLCLHLALRFILLALSSHLPLGPPVAWGRCAPFPPLTLNACSLGPASCLGSGLCSQSNLQCLVLLVPGPCTSCSLLLHSRPDSSSLFPFLTLEASA